MRNIEPLAPVQRRPSSRRWPVIIIGMLALHVAMMAVACVIATRDKSFSVVPNYYAKAVSWDRQQAEKRASEKLGWRVSVEASEHVDRSGRRAVSFTLTDDHGRTIEGATMKVSFFHHAHADREQMVTLTPDAGDARRFTVFLPMPQAGLWEFHFEVSARGQTFVSSKTEILSNGSEAKSL